MPITEFIWGRSGVGLSEHAWNYAEDKKAAWIGNDAASHLSLLRSTVREELAFSLEQYGTPREVMEKKVEEALRTWKLQHLADQEPTSLSTGQMRRLVIAAALLLEPEFLVLDCPLDGLDRGGVETLVDILHRHPGDVVVYDRHATILAEYAGTVKELCLSASSDSKDGVGSRILVERPVSSLDFRQEGRKEQNSQILLQVDKEIFSQGDFSTQPISITIPSGSIVHLQGENGSGKTTFFLGILGLYEDERLEKKSPASSFIRRLQSWIQKKDKDQSQVLDMQQGQLSTSPSINQHINQDSSRRIEPDPQSPYPAYGWAPTAMDRSFSQRTVLKEVAMGVTNEQAEQALRWAGLEEYKDIHPLDLPSSDRRILGVLCAMVRGPQIVLLDEPTEGLDTEGHRKLLSLMRSYVTGEYHQLYRRQGEEENNLPFSPSILWTCHDHDFAGLISDSSCTLSIPSESIPPVIDSSNR